MTALVEVADLHVAIAGVTIVDGLSFSLHAGQVSVADGTDEAAKRLNRVLTNDPGTGIARHVDAGYEEAIETAREKGVKIPMMEPDRS